MRLLLLDNNILLSFRHIRGFPVCAHFSKKESKCKKPKGCVGVMDSGYMLKKMQ